MRKKKKFTLAELDWGERVTNCETRQLVFKAVQLRLQFAVASAWRHAPANFITNPTSPFPYWVDFIREGKGLAV